jgi:outer membrane protein OmpA-like peptidoglycan-associated protein
MYEEQDREQEGIVGWIIGIGAFVAVAISLWMGLMGAFSNQNGAATNSAATSGTAATTTIAASPAASATSAIGTSAVGATAVVGSAETVSIYFDLNKFEPPADTATKLDGLINYGRANSNSKIAITGYTDKTGDAAKNAELSKQRAVAVKNQLISAGMPEDRIMMQKPQQTTGDQTDNKEARRVDVYTLQ